MARKRAKKRTHVGARNGPPNGTTTNSSASRDPKSMVIRIGAGEVGPSVSQLVKDVRTMMEPGTATRLKERRSNKLRDYTAMAGPLDVSHLLLFSRSTAGNINLRIALTPRGPTLHFRVEKYSLSKDVKHVQKHPQGGGKEYLAAPLLVMNSLLSPTRAEDAQPTVPRHLESLTTTIFQSLFPPLLPQSTPLSSIRRVLLLNREIPKLETPSPIDASPSSPDEGSYILNLRHYAIKTKHTDVSRGLRRLGAANKPLRHGSKRARGLPNLGKLEDIADYMLDTSATAVASEGFASAGESEAETDAEIEVLRTNPKKVLNKKQMAALRSASSNSGRSTRQQPELEKRAVKLTELGPRMKLRMTKVEEGICGGKVMWHDFLQKSAEETEAMEKLWEARRKEKEERKKLQKENVENKRKEAGLIRKSGNGANAGEGEDVDEDLEDDS